MDERDYKAMNEELNPSPYLGDVNTKIRTKEEILARNGFDFEAFKLENEYSAKNLLLAMEEYSEQTCKVVHNLYNQREYLYKKENQRPDSKF